MSTRCPTCGWFYSARYKPVGEVCDNTAHLPVAYKAELAAKGVAWPACKGRVVDAVSLDEKAGRD